MTIGRRIEGDEPPAPTTVRHRRLRSGFCSAHSDRSLRYQALASSEHQWISHLAAGDAQSNRRRWRASEPEHPREFQDTGARSDNPHRTQPICPAARGLASMKGKN
ncbi:hypothetical protein G6F63_015982 [Rhizopus arrhizus]|nr:hypothetical protein G6F63_015982 [Rhizopus arrhizus]